MTLIAVCAVSLSLPAAAATFSVTTTADAGPGSMRQAILDANASPGADSIAFAIGSGPRTIAPLSPLPVLTGPAVVDATTQPGFAGTPIIELSGASAGLGADGIALSGGSSTVRGFVINRFVANALNDGGNGVVITGAGGNVVEGNWIGLDATGTQDLGNSFGVFVSASPNNRIGGAAAAQRNVVSGNGSAALDGGFGIFVQDPGSTGGTIEGNFVGTNAAGTAALGNEFVGIELFDAPGNTIRGNVVAGHGLGGIYVFGASGVSVVAGNFVGTDAGGTLALGNDYSGIEVEDAPGVTVGGAAAADSNRVAATNGPGIYVHEAGVTSGTVRGNVVTGNNPGVIVSNFATGVTIRGNQITGNTALGIDLDDDGATPNDNGDTDTGANALQNFPVLASASASSSSTTVTGTLASTPSATFTIEAFGNPVCDSSGFGEGASSLGTQTVTTDGAGTASFVLSFAVPASGVVTATATSSSGSTSEFSNCVAVTTTAGNADLGITLTDAPDPVAAGEFLVYTLIVSNAGPATATAVTATLTLPAGVSLVSAGSGCTAAASSVTCALGSLAPGGSVSRQVTVQTTTTGTLTATATVSAAENDPATANNGATATTTVGTTGATEADLSVALSDSPDPVLPGGRVSYRIDFANAGPAAAGNVVVTVTLPAGLTAVIIPAVCSASGTTVTCNLGGLAAGASGSGTISGTAPAAPGTLTVAAAINSDRDDPAPGNNSDSETTTVSGEVAGADSLFRTLAPCRVLDTRGGAPLGGGAFAAGELRSLTFAGVCGIPAGATAVSVNFTVTQTTPTGLAYMTVFPSGSSMPTVSTLNWTAGGQTVANAAIVPLGPGGTISIFVSAGTHVIADVNGYWETPSATTGPESGFFRNLSPCRVLDTRGGAPIVGGPFAGGEVRTLTFAGVCGIPGNASAVSLNFTVTGTAPSVLSYMTVFPGGSAMPVVSTLNWEGANRTVANAAIVPLGPGGTISIFVSAGTHVIADVNGYFASDEIGAAGSFATLPPCRVLDTRGGAPITGGAFAGGELRTLTFAGVCGIPAGASALSLNFTVTQTSPTGLAYMTVAPGGQLPLVSTLNWTGADQTVANAAIVPLGPGGTISIFVSDGTHVIADVNGYFQ